MTPARLRIVSSRAPYRRAGIGFDPTGNKTFAVAIVALADLPDWRATLKALLEDPHLDVMAGQSIFWPVTCEKDVADLLEAVAEYEAARPERRDTLAILAEAAALDAERQRDAAAPGGDDEDGAGTAPAEAEQDTTAAAPTEPAPAADGPPPRQPRGKK